MCTACPAPNFADFDGDGDLDLMCGSFLDDFTYFENTGTSSEPVYAAGRSLSREGEPIKMHLCMIVVSAVDWDDDGDVDLIVGQEDGRIALVEHTGRVDDSMPVFAEPVFFQQQADEVKFGALVTPVSFDWDGDGDEDLVCGNTAGEIGWIENLGWRESAEVGRTGAAGGGGPADPDHGRTERIDSGAGGGEVGLHHDRRG